MTFEEIQKIIEKMLSKQQIFQENQLKLQKNQIGFEETQVSCDHRKLDRLSDRIDRLAEQVENLMIVSQRNDDRFGKTTKKM